MSASVSAVSRGKSKASAFHCPPAAVFPVRNVCDLSPPSTAHVPYIVCKPRGDGRSPRRGCLSARRLPRFCMRTTHNSRRPFPYSWSRDVNETEGMPHGMLKRNDADINTDLHLCINWVIVLRVVLLGGDGACNDFIQRVRTRVMHVDRWTGYVCFFSPSLFRTLNAEAVWYFLCFFPAWIMLHEPCLYFKKKSW